MSRDSIYPYSSAALGWRCAPSRLSGFAAHGGARAIWRIDALRQRREQIGPFTHSPSEHASGVDVTDGNSVYVGDEPKQGEFRIQKFSSAGAPLASVTEKFLEMKPNGSSRSRVSPWTHALKRVYVLSSMNALGEEEGGSQSTPKSTPRASFMRSRRRRRPKNSCPPKAPPTASWPARACFEAQSEVAGKRTESALLEPSGITRRPEDERRGHPRTGRPGRLKSLLVAAQRVHSSGALGTRWVDTTNALKAKGLPPAPTKKAPRRRGPDLTGRHGRGVLVELESQIWEIPAELRPRPSPEAALRFDNPLQNLIEFPGLPEPAEGAAWPTSTKPRRRKRRNGVRHGECSRNRQHTSNTFPPPWRSSSRKARDRSKPPRSVGPAGSATPSTKAAPSTSPVRRPSG